MKFDPKEYEYLWTDYDVNYIFASCYLSENFRKFDIVMIYDPSEKGLHFFLSKKDRIKLSEIGVLFYRDSFDRWKSDIIKTIKKVRKVIESCKKENEKELDDNEIKERFLELVNSFLEMGNLYFYTEFFLMDKVEKMAENDNNLRKKMEEMGEIKLKAREVLNELYNYDIVFKKYISAIEERRVRNDVEWLSYEEILNLIDKNEVDISKKGMTNWALTIKNGWKIIEGINAKTAMKLFEKHFFRSESDHVKGIIANKGKYTGTVKIIKTTFSDKVKHEISKVKKGDVLIANTTGPEVMEACERAGAIVTDEGGLTSHAAIVSRELGIPCIVGTKIATKTFKHRDLVEVDADNGIVRKIKK